MQLEEVKAQIRALSMRERLELAEYAIASVRGEGATPVKHDGGVDGEFSFTKWAAAFAEDGLTEEEWEAAFGSRRALELGRPNPFTDFAEEE